MELVYAALLLHGLGKPVDEEGVKKVLEAAGAHVDHAQIKALVSSLKSVNIDDAIKQAAFMQAAPQSSDSGKKEEHKEEKKEAKAEEKAEEAAAGLGALFG
jgi:large subunit ribosomal protein L12